MARKKKTAEHRKPHGFLRQYFRLLRFYLVTGLLVWMPLIVTVWLTWWLFKNVGLGLENLIESGYGFLNRLGEDYKILAFLPNVDYFKGSGFLIALLLFLTTGFLTRNLVGRRLIRAGERILHRIPFISRVYRAVGQIRDVFVNRDGTVFQQVCLVQYPRKGIYAVAFITSREQGIVQEAIGQEMISVFLPTTPNPTSGFLLYLSPSDVTVLDISVEEAMKLIISGGAYLPSLPSLTEVEEEPTSITV